MESPPSKTIDFVMMEYGQELCTFTDRSVAHRVKDRMEKSGWSGLEINVRTVVTQQSIDLER